MTEAKKLSRISVSKISTFIQCPFKYFGQYELKVKQPKKLSLCIGNWFDDSINYNYEHKLFSDEDLPVKEVKEFFVGKLEQEIQSIEIWDDQELKEHPKVLKDRGVKWIEKFHSDICHYVKPSQVQPYLKMGFKGSKIELYAKPDVIEITETIRDNKTSGKIWQQSKADSSLQPLAYSLFADGIGKNIIREFWFDILVKSIKPKIQQLKVIVDDQKRRNFLIFMNNIKTQIESSYSDNNFPPSAFYKGDNLCSKKYCPIAKECARRWSIRIKE